MGPNGSGKSTLAYARMGHPAYVITEGRLFFDGEDVTELGAPETGAIVITHYQRILDYVTSDHVHVFVDGRIVEWGGAELAKKLEKEGYVPYEPEEVPA